MAKQPKQVCHICVNTMKGEPVAQCPHCGTNLANPAEEFVQIPMTKGTYKKSKMSNLVGSTVLTNRRFLWFDQNAGATAGAMFGMLGAAIAAAAATTKDVFALPLETIANAEVRKAGLGKWLVITTKDGAEYFFGAPKPDNWVAAILADVNYIAQTGQYPAYPQ